MTRDTSRPAPRIDEQIAELRRELSMRETVYPKLIREGKLRASTADYCRSCLEAALASLEFLRDNREVIIEAVKASREAA